MMHDYDDVDLAEAARERRSQAFELAILESKRGELASRLRDYVNEVQRGEPEELLLTAEQLSLAAGALRKLAQDLRYQRGFARDS